MRIRSQVDGQVVVLRRLREDCASRFRNPAAAGARLVLGHVDVVHRNNTEDVDVFLVSSFQLLGSTGLLVLGRGVRDWAV